MSEAIETRSFRYKDVIVRYSKSEREEYVVCIERLDKEVCHLFSLGIPITDDVGVREFVDALHREGIDLSLPDVVSIVNLIRAEYGSEDLNKEGSQTNEPTKEQAGAKQQEPGHQLVHQEEGQDGMNSYYMLGTILPREEPKALPSWLSKFALPNLYICLKFPACQMALVSYTEPNSQYIVLAVEETKFVKTGDYVDVLRQYTPIAVIPKYIAKVYDPFYNKWYYAAFLDGELKVVSVDFDDFIRAIRAIPEAETMVIGNVRYLDFLKGALPAVKDYPISAGIYEDTIIDPYGVLDLEDYGVQPLLEAYDWIMGSYPPPNNEYAWFDVLATVAKILTPELRRHQYTFADYIVYNHGEGDEGKTTLVEYVLKKLLGGDLAARKYYMVLLHSVRTEPQVRNLISLHRLPLILDDQKRRDLINNVGIIMSAAIGMGVIGVHAKRYGQGIEEAFINMRGLVINTNVLFTEFLRETAGEASDRAIRRRFIVLSWSHEKLSPRGFREIKPIYGFVLRLWRRYRPELMKSSNLLDLMEKLVIAIGHEYQFDPELGDRVREVVEHSLRIIRRIKEEKVREMRDMSDDQKLRQNAYKFVTEALRVTQPTAVKVLRLILENPGLAGIQFSRPKDPDRLSQYMEALDNAINELADRYKIIDMDKGPVGTDQDAVIVYSILKKLQAEGRVQIVLLAGYPLVGGSPSKFMNAVRSEVGRSGRYGYYVPLYKIVRVMLGDQFEEEGGVEVDEVSRGGRRDS